MNILEIAIDTFKTKEPVEISVYSVAALLSGPEHRNDTLMASSQDEVWYFGEAREAIHKIPYWAHNKKVISFYCKNYRDNNIYFIHFEE